MRESTGAAIHVSSGDTRRSSVPHAGTLGGLNAEFPVFVEGGSKTSLGESEDLPGSSKYSHRKSTVDCQVAPLSISEKKFSGIATEVDAPLEAGAREAAGA